MKLIAAMYSPRIVGTLVYMLQSSDYRISQYLAWLHRTTDFSEIMKRRKLRFTTKARLLYATGLLIYGALVAFLIASIVIGGSIILFAFFLLLALPYVIAYLLILPLLTGQWLIQGPKEKRLIEEATHQMRNYHCRKIAIAGSYGKTSFKEMLTTILSETLHIAASHGNMNTPLGLASFIQKLDGSEDVLIFELGEERVGDVKKLCKLSRPNMGVITGISEAHLSSFGTVDNIVATVFELSDYLKSYDVYKNGDSDLVAANVSAHDQHVYSDKGVNGWKVSHIESGLEGTSFAATKHSKVVWAHSKLVGKHQVGPLVACIDIADKLGLSVTDIAEGIKNTRPFEHRMQPLHLSGAMIIDDTYNGNPKGVEAGLEFLESISAKRKIYVTPGLVEQGDRSDVIHEMIGRQAGRVCDVVILMNNSTTEAIRRGLKEVDFAGELKIINNPVSFYSNLGHYVAAGDVVLMQNDWTDNYA